MHVQRLRRRGQRLGRYELLAQVGEGGMASVWLARSHGSRGFEKLVALKMIKAQLADDVLFERWFLDEAKIAQRIFHSNVTTTLDLGEEDGALFLVMEWIDGDSLGRVRRAYQRASGKPLPLPIALRIVADMCKGLHAAHELTDERGEDLHVVHRDVSPNNVLVTANGAVKLIDFGIATARDRSSPETMLGVVRGKINYLAPEQIHRKTPLDRRCDVWAAGVCLYELVVGALPFPGTDSEDVMRRIVSATAPPAFEGDSGVDEILCRSLAHYPEDRFATAAEMQQAIEALLAPGGGVSEADVAAFLAREIPRLGEERRAWVDEALKATATTTVAHRDREGELTARTPGTANTRRFGTRFSRIRGVLAVLLVLVLGSTVAVMLWTRGRDPVPSGEMHAEGASGVVEAPVVSAPVPADQTVATPVVGGGHVTSSVTKKPNANVGAKKPRIVSSAKAVSSPPKGERDLGF